MKESFLNYQKGNNLKLIKLTRNKFAKVDNQDYKYLNQYNWFASKGRSTYYASRSVTLGYNKEYMLKMHILIMCPPKGYDIDHRNRDTLDNRKINLRYVNKSQNNQNKKMNNLYNGTPTSSKFKGVSLVITRKGSKRWKSQITLNSKHIYLGHFDNEIDAAKAYNVKAKELFGEYALLNNINNSDFIKTESRNKILRRMA